MKCIDCGSTFRDAFFRECFNCRRKKHKVLFHWNTHSSARYYILEYDRMLKTIIPLRYYIEIYNLEHKENEYPYIVYKEPLELKIDNKYIQDKYIDGDIDISEIDEEHYKKIIQDNIIRGKWRWWWDRYGFSKKEWNIENDEDNNVTLDLCLCSCEKCGEFNIVGIMQSKNNHENMDKYCPKCESTQNHIILNTPISFSVYKFLNRIPKHKRKELIEGEKING